MTFKSSDGQTWTIEFRAPSRMPKVTLRSGARKPIYGQCDWDARRILIRKGLTPRETFYTLLHEIAHLELGPSVDEGAVSSLERTLRRVVRRWEGELSL